VVADRPAVAVEAERPALSDQAPADESNSESKHEPNQQARMPARGEVPRLLKRHGSTLTAERVGVSISHACRLLREERPPHGVARRKEER
jgi:hypothetical protein